MNRRLFREEALARRGRAEPLDGLLRVTAPHMWMVIAALTVVLAGAVAWALLGQVDETVEADCALVLPGERFAVLAEMTATIEEVLVEAGDSVDVGQPLARIRIPDLDLRLRVARSVLERLELQSDASDGGAANASVAAARAEVDELEAVRAAGRFVPSPVAGEIASHRLVRGQAFEAGAHLAFIRSDRDAPLEVVAFLQQDAAQLIQPGQQATVVRMAGSSGGLNAVVSGVSDQPSAVADWLADLGLSPPPRSHLVRLALPDQQAVGIADGELCLLRIVVDTYAPIGLLGAAEPDRNDSA